MYEYLRLSGHPLVAACELEQLPPITVICGPNSSGKSTLLAALIDPVATQQGVASDSVFVEQLYQSTLERQAWNTGSQAHNDGYRELLLAVAGTQRAWYSADVNEFDNRLAAAWLQHPLLRGQRRQAIRDELLDLIPAAPGTVLVPPKRVLEVIAPVGDRSSHPDGTGVATVLFRRKNQLETSAEHALYRRVAEAFTEVSAGYEFDLVQHGGNQIALKFRAPNGDWLDAPLLGLGLQDLLVILHLAIEPAYEVVCVEEPESHLHPEWQRRLLTALGGMEDTRFLLTTHSNVFLDNVLVDRVLMTRFVDGQITVEDATSRASILDDLGYSVADNLVSDLIVLVEGVSDVPVLEEILRKRGVWGEYVVKFWPLGGDVMDQLDLSVFAEVYRVVAVVDQDPGSGHVRDRFLEVCNTVGVEVTRLERYAIENYFTLAALQKVFPTELPEDLEELAPDARLSDQLGFNVKKHNRALARAMTWDDLADNDLGRFVLRLEELLRQGEPLGQAAVAV